MNTVINPFSATKPRKLLGIHGLNGAVGFPEAKAQHSKTSTPMSFPSPHHTDVTYWKTSVMLNTTSSPQLLCSSFCWSALDTLNSTVTSFSTETGFVSPLLLHLLTAYFGPAPGSISFDEWRTVIHLRVLHLDDELSTFGKQSEKKTKLMAMGKKKKERKNKTKI